MTKKAPIKDHKKNYNKDLSNLIEGIIPYDKKIYQEIAPYIEKHLWKHMDKDRVKKAVMVLDDPLYDYGNDIEMLKQTMKCFVPKVKKLLKIDKTHPLMDSLQPNYNKSGLLDKQIKQQINLYINNKYTRGSIVRIFQEGATGSIDLTQPYTKSIYNDTVPNTQKTIIANIMILLILEEEYKEYAKTRPNKIIHRFEENMETE